MYFSFAKVFSGTFVTVLATLSPYLAASLLPPIGLIKSCWRASYLELNNVCNTGRGGSFDPEKKERKKKRRAIGVGVGGQAGRAVRGKLAQQSCTQPVLQSCGLGLAGLGKKGLEQLQGCWGLRASL